MLIKHIKGVKNSFFRKIEDIIFSISTYTSLLLVYFSLITFKLVLTGSYINCNSKEENFSRKLSPTCFHTFSRFPTDLRNHTDSPLHSDNGGIESAVINNHHYLLVPYILLTQAFLFYLPKLVSKYLEADAFQVTMKYFANDILIRPDKDIVNMQNAYQKFLGRLLSRYYFALGNIFCELLNVFLIVIQIYLMKVNLGTKFYEAVQTENPFDIVFPKMLTCTHPRLGQNGTMEYEVINCHLPINHVNETIYSWLWVVVNLLLFLTTLVLLYRILSAILYDRSNAFNRFEFSRLCWGSLKQDNLMVASKWGFSRWLILRRLAMEMSGEDFGLLVEALQTAPD